ncbi:MAG: hypothetical protein MJ231_08805, partial [bacterium]|nr:hypothetical protein [bacterium]
TLQLLLEGNYTMTELVEKLNAQEKTPIFNNSVVSKYINTCRFCGIDIHKIHNKYFVSKTPFGLEVSSAEIDLLEELQKASIQLPNSISREFKQFIQTLGKYSNKEISRVDAKTIAIVYDMFERAVENKRKIILMFKVKSLLECTPLEIVTKNNKIFFKVLVKGKERLIGEERISGIEVSDRQYVEDIVEKAVTFRLSGDLAKRYTPRENEVVDIINTNELKVTNKFEDKKSLFARLMRYDTCCEILYPLQYREDFKNMLNKTLNNYGVNGECY